MENNILNEQAIKEAINAIRPALQNDGGDIEFIKYDAENKNVHVKLVGACAGCPPLCVRKYVPVVPCSDLLSLCKMKTIIRLS